MTYEAIVPLPPAEGKDPGMMVIRVFDCPSVEAGDSVVKACLNAPDLKEFEPEYPMTWVRADGRTNKDLWRLMSETCRQEKEFWDTMADRYPNGDDLVIHASADGKTELVTEDNARELLDDQTPFHEEPAEEA